MAAASHDQLRQSILRKNVQINWSPAVFPEMPETSFKVKCSKTATARRFSLSNPTIASLCSHAEASWGINDPRFWYVDDDGDRISVEDDHELSAAIAAMRDSCVNLCADFTLGSAVGARDQALASQASSNCLSSDKDDELSKVVIDSEAAPGNDVNPVALPANPSSDAAPERSHSPEVAAAIYTQHNPDALQQMQQLEQTIAPNPEQSEAASAALKMPRVVVHGDPMAGKSAVTHRISESADGVSKSHMQQEIQELREALACSREQAAKDAECARQTQRCRMKRAEERFDAVTSVLKLQLRAAEARFAAAEAQIKLLADERQQFGALAPVEPHGPSVLSDAVEALRAELREAVSEKFLLNNMLETQAAQQNQLLNVARDANKALVIQNTALKQQVQNQREAIEQMRSEIAKAEANVSRDFADQTQLRAEAERLKKEAADAARASSPVVPQLLTSASAAPRSHLSIWKRVAGVAGAAPPSDADIEKFERTLAVLRSMSFCIDDDVRLCVVINNGDVPIVVDQMLAAVA